MAKIFWLSAFVAGALLSGTAVAEEPVTLSNFTRAETDGYFAKAAKAGVGVWSHRRNPLQVDEQDVIRLNRDTLYSTAVLDLSTPATIRLPDAGGRFMSMLVINEDHFVKLVAYNAGEYQLTQKMLGTRYAYVFIRTFVNPNDPADIRAANAVQDGLAIAQANPGVAEFPDWNASQRDAIRQRLLQLAPYADQSRAGFGDKGEVDPINHLISTAAGWGGNPREAAVYVSGVPENADGLTAYSMTLRDVPVDGFWSITVYNQNGFMEAPIEKASVNNVTAIPNADGSVTVHFGGEPGKPNYLRILPGWNYTIRLYRPRAEILEGRWTAPALSLQR